MQRHHKSRSHLIVLVVFILVNLSNAGLMKRSIRTVREVYPPDIEPEIEGNQAQVCIVGETTYEVDEIVPAEQPCLKCRCQPPGVQCETVQCVKRPGCKAVHRPNRCCPNYQCECEHNGKIYANGEKLETYPGGECKVCYCRGGEVQCAEVSCYIRKNCEGKRVPGKCCPKYDHCPPIDSLSERPALLTEALLVTPKSIIDLIDSINLINSTHLPITTTSYSIIPDENKVPDTDSNNSITPKPELDEIFKTDEVLPRITIQEIIPERKEIPITSPPKLNEPQGTLLIEESIAPSERMDDLTITDTDPESSEIAEVFQHPPPVLRIGDKLLFLKKGELVPEKDTSSTPESVITIIGAEGLQRGFEESFEIQDGKLGDNIDTNAADTNELELNTAESTHIISFVKRKEKSQVSATNITNKTVTETSQEVLSTQSSKDIKAFDENLEKSNVSTESNLPSEINNMEELTQAVSNSDSFVNDTKTQTSTEQAISKNTDPIIEQNPAYPPIPDIMPAVGDVSQKFEVELESDNETMKILPGVFELLDNSTQTENINVSSHSEWLKINNTNLFLTNTTLINVNATLPDELLNAKSPIDVDENIFSYTEEVFTTSNPIENYTSSTTGEIKIAGTHDTLPKMNLFIETTISNILKGDQLSTTTPELTTAQNAAPSISPLEIETIAIKSSESLEKDDSGEQTTRKPDHLPITSSDENASVQKDANVSEATDMTGNVSKESQEILEQTSSENAEATTKSLPSDVELLIPKTSFSKPEKELPNPVTIVSFSDVEMISPVMPIKEIASTKKSINEDPEIKVEGLPKPTQIPKVESSTYEMLPMPVQASAKMIKKRDIGLNLGFDDASIEVFPKPQVVDPNKVIKTSIKKVQPIDKKDPEDFESQEIFKELLNDLSTEDTVGQQRTRNGLNGLSEALTSTALGGGRGTKREGGGGVLQFIDNIFSPNKGRN